MNKTTLYFSKKRENAIIPSKKDEDAGYDIYSCFEENEIYLRPNDIISISTGIGTAFSDDYVMFIKERSSTGKIGLSLRMGVIDSGYRGEIYICLNNTSNKVIVITKDINKKSTDKVIYYPYNKAIAQAVLCTIPKLKVEEISDSDLLNFKSDRGINMLGSSGK